MFNLILTNAMKNEHMISILLCMEKFIIPTLTFEIKYEPYEKYEYYVFK